MARLPHICFGNFRLLTTVNAISIILDVDIKYYYTSAQYRYDIPILWTTISNGFRNHQA